MNKAINRFLQFFSLFGSVSTLLCCALPVTLVSIGMGSVFASLTSSFPQIIWLTSHKNTLFVITGFLLSLSYVILKKSKFKSCPIDLKQRDACQSSKKVSTVILYLSIVMYIIGLLFSFIIPRIIYGL